MWVAGAQVLEPSASQNASAENVYVCMGVPIPGVASPNPSCCRHVGSEPENVSLLLSFFFSFSLCVIVPAFQRNIFK